ncbi:extracellular solute-binding protein [Paenibacillus sp. N4]|uniref:extracellular solute-binding protein n=1 Tax=Paenibacillus vietnamensis TaxID=2590547 RepID=UPI001CD17C88|nr:extracellular solute-binding protein [Paenibacillus vietnamensis]MCA0757107.1 extracellular solute-binding protein [Paenibacillus vietnamensis]
MTNKKRFALLVPIIAMLLLAAACSSPETGTAPRTKLKGETVPISIIANLHTPTVPSDRIEKIMEEATGTQLNIQWVPDGSYEERVNAAVATETLPQAVFLKNSASLMQFRGAIRDGQFWEIGPLLDEFPNLARLSDEVLRNTSVDGRIYSLYQERPLSRQGIIYRADWAERLGLSAPSSLDKLYEMLERFTNGDPDGNGRKDTIGLADRSDLVYGAFKTIASYFGVPNGWEEEGGKLKPEFMFPEYVAAMNFVRKLHQEGLVNEDFPVMGKADQQELFIQGKAGVYIGSLSDVVSLHAKLTKNNPDAKLDMHNRVTGPEGERVWSTPGYGAVVLFPKSAIPDDKRLMEVLAFFDKLMEPELANMLNWGIPGEHYELIDGKVVQSPDYERLNKESRPYLSMQVGGPGSIPGFLEAGSTLPVRLKSEKLVKDNESILVHDPTAALDSATFNDIGERLQDIITDATYHYMIGMMTEKEFGAEVERWKKEGGDRIIREFNEALSKQRKAL